MDLDSAAESFCYQVAVREIRMRAMDQSASRDFWLRAARRLSLRVNVAWLLEGMAVPMVLLGLVGMVGIFFWRGAKDAGELPEWWVFLLVIFVLALMAGWFRNRGRLFSQKQAMVEVEGREGLHNALSVATAGVGRWPNPPAEGKLKHGYHWNWPRLLAPPLAVGILICAALSWPIEPVSGARAQEQPSALTALESSLERLRQEEVVQEEYLDELEEKIEELRAKNEENWFSHASLESTDALKQAHQNELDRLSSELAKQESLLRQLESASELSVPEREKLHEGLQQALEKMGEGKLKPNEDLAKKLQQLSPHQLGEMSDEELDALRQEMREMQQRLADAGAQTGKERPDWVQDEMAQNGSSQGGHQQESGQGDPQPGQGGRHDEPGHDPNALGQAGEKLAPQLLEKVDSADPENQLPGEIVQTEDGEHSIRQMERSLEQGGMTGRDSEGGGRLREQQFSPVEQRAVKEFFR